MPVQRKALLLLLFCLPAALRAQQVIPTSEIVPDSQVDRIISDSVKKAFSINYGIWRVYHYTDRSGQYYCVLTESRDTIEVNGDQRDTINHRIRAIDLRQDKGGMTKVWEINDHIDQDEMTIWFMTRFAEFNDFDGDGLIEPIIIYGTTGGNGLGDGRVKFIVYYKGKKFAIRHQNSITDGESHTEVDWGFHSLPPRLIKSVQLKMDLIRKEGAHLLIPEILDPTPASPHAP